ncbi:MAG: phosphoglycolate phosphatase [Alphaproteobacteria bacterium]|nr:phosphoglycolate phosphatase [Alphaproteobacteria bacterium]
MCLRGSTILFDLDGTLVDSAPDLLFALNRTIELVGAAPMSLANLRPFVSDGTMAMIREGLAASNCKIEQSVYEKLFPVFLKHYEFSMTHELKSFSFPGVEACLKSLREQGASLAVCTNKMTDFAHLLLEKLGYLQHFKLVAGGDTYHVRKPHPDHLLLTMNALNGVRDRTIMVGDTEVDIAAARAANINVIAVTFGYTKVPIKQFSPDDIISHFDNLPLAFGRLLVRKTSPMK